MSGEEQLITFKVGNNVYGVNIKYVREVVEPKNIVQVPKSPYYIEGIMDLRGKLVTLVNLAKVLEIPTDGMGIDGNKMKVLIINIEELDKNISSDTEIGLIVDHVLGVIRLNSNGLKKTKIPSEVIDKVINRDGKLILILDVKKVIELLNFDSIG